METTHALVPLTLTFVELIAQPKAATAEETGPPEAAAVPPLPTPLTVVAPPPADPAPPDSDPESPAVPPPNAFSLAAAALEAAASASAFAATFAPCASPAACAVMPAAFGAAGVPARLWASPVRMTNVVGGGVMGTGAGSEAGLGIPLKSPPVPNAFPVGALGMGGNPHRSFKDCTVSNQ